MSSPRHCWWFFFVVPYVNKQNAKTSTDKIHLCNISEHQLIAKIIPDLRRKMWPKCLLYCTRNWMCSTTYAALYICLLLRYVVTNIWETLLRHSAAVQMNKYGSFAIFLLLRRTVFASAYVTTQMHTRENLPAIKLQCFTNQWKV